MLGLVIYTKTGCPYCSAAMEKCKAEGIPYEEINTSQDLKALAYIKETFDAKRVPVFVRDGVLEEIGFQGGG